MTPEQLDDIEMACNTCMCPTAAEGKALIDAGLTKQDCLALVDRAGIKLPAMYRLGYSNNNCIGCVKGGMGYWNKIRVDFPDVFDRMARLEADIGYTLFDVPLGELDPSRGNYPTELSADCSLTCAEIAAALGDSDE